jgi:FMN phosphatase YigB (HAD superfamily)
MIIVFDLQGTLIENGVFPSPAKQVKYFLRINKDFHEFVTDFEKVFMTKSYDNLTEAFTELAAFFGSEADNFAIERLVGMWNKNKLLSKIFPDAIPALEDLKAKKILIANIDCFTKEILERFKLSDYFEKVILSCDVGKLKPEIIKDLVEEYGAEELFMVGDSVASDMRIAQDNGIRSLLLDRNNRMDYDPKVSSLTNLTAYLENE